MMRIWLDLLARPQTKGFTLLELLIASVMSFFVVSATGFAIFVMTKESLTTEVSSDTQFNLNRAMDFMADEAKSASSIYTTAAAATTAATDFTTPSGAQVILGLNVAGLPQPIIYYVRPRQSNDVWFGPNIIYRWGPRINATRAYDDDASTAGQQITPSTWTSAALVDGIPGSSYYVSGGNNIPLSGINEQGKKCPAGSSTAATGWTAIPSATPFGTNSGFFVCVRNDGSQAEIHAYASLADQLQTAGSTDSRGFDKASYGVVSFVYPRSTSDVTVGTSTTFSVPAGNPTQASLNATGCTLPLTITYQGSASGSSATASMTTTSNFELLLYNASPSMSISGLTYTPPASATSTVQFTGSGCTVTAKLTTP